jgi:tryptophan 2,3-dioxygenase
MLRLIGESLELLEAMSPKEYQKIRLQLGNVSGQESRGFRVIVQVLQYVWRSYQAVYLRARGLSVEAVYDSKYAHDDAYSLAECLMPLDELFQKFRSNHILLIHRTIGMGAALPKGRCVDLLAAGAKHRFFPELWDIRAHDGRMGRRLWPLPQIAAARTRSSCPAEGSPRRRAPQVSSVKGVKRVSRSK